MVEVFRDDRRAVVHLRSIRWLPSLLILAVPVAVVSGYWFATSNEAYVVAKRVIETDPAIQTLMQQTDSYRLALLDGYRYSTFGTSAKAEYRFVVSGGAGRGTVDLVLERSAGRWRLVEGALRVGDAEPVALEPRELD